MTKSAPDKTKTSQTNSRIMHHPSLKEFNRALKEFSLGAGMPLTDSVQSRMDVALGQIAMLFGFDAALLVIFTEFKAARWFVGTWYDPHLPISSETVTTFDCPWTINEIKQGHFLSVLNLDDLPSMAKTDRRTCMQLGIQALYGIPLHSHSKITGVLVLGAKQSGYQPATETIDQAQILGQILANNIQQAEHTERLSDAIEAAETGLWSLDFSTMTFWATEKARFIHGFDATQELSLDTLLSVVHPDDREVIRQTIELAATDTRDIRVEYRVVLDNATVRWIVARGRSYDSAPGNMLQLTGVCADITERRLAEEKLQNAQALTKAIFDSVPGLLYLYSEDGKLLRWNKQHELLTGYSAEELKDFPVDQWFNEHDLNKLQSEWSKVFIEGQTTTEFNLKLKNGSFAPFALTGVQVEIDGKPHLVGIGIETTEKRRAEISLAQLRNELAHATRVTTLGELASALAHELNQPLAAILSNAQASRRLLSRQPPDLVEVKDALEDIIRDDKRAGEIIHGLRNMVTKEQSKITHLDMNTLVSEVASLIHGELILSNVSLELVLDPDLPEVEAGQTEIQQVLLNLMINGIHAQRLTDPSSRHLSITTRHDTTRVIVAIRDHGVGIQEDLLLHIFEPFYSTKTSGLGMGLAICRRIAEANHGDLWAENNADAGATFYFALPVAMRKS